MKIRPLDSNLEPPWHSDSFKRQLDLYLIIVKWFVNCKLWRGVGRVHVVLEIRIGQDVVGDEINADSNTLWMSTIQYYAIQHNTIQFNKVQTTSRSLVIILMDPSKNLNFARKKTKKKQPKKQKQTENDPR